MSGFGLEPFLDSPKVSRWDVSGFALGAFSDSPKVRRLEVPGFAIVAFSGSPSGQSLGGGRIWAWTIFGQPQGQTLGGVRICYDNIFGQSQGQSLGAAFCYGNILQQVIPKSLIRNSLCSTNGYSHLIILTSYLSLCRHSVVLGMVRGKSWGSLEEATTGQPVGHPEGVDW